MEWVHSTFPNHYILIAGDLNLPDIKWTWSSVLEKLYISSELIQLKDRIMANLVNRYNLQQSIDTPNSKPTDEDDLLDRNSIHHTLIPLLLV